MTRINLVPPSELSDQHLFAEFREIKMVPKALGRSIRARGADGVLKIIPQEYCLGKGHVSFFYDKGMYLWKRYEEIKDELGLRGIKFNRDSLLDSYGVFMTSGYPFYKDYIPTDAALVLIRARIAQKLAMKPHWYRWTSVK